MDTFCDSANIHKTFWSHCGLCLKVHFALFFATSFRQCYTLVNDSNPQFEQLCIFGHCSLHHLTSATCIQQMHTLCLFATFACFLVLIEYDFGNLFWSFWQLGWSHNWLPLMTSCIPTVQCYCSHQCWKSPKHINEGGSKMAITHYLMLYSFCPHMSVILLKKVKPGGKSFIFLSKQLSLQMELAIAEFVLFNLAPFNLVIVV